MKLDPRDRPTVQELLEDEWFQEADEDVAAAGDHGQISEQTAGPI